MKVKVLKSFVDIVEGKKIIQKQGKTIDMSEERFEEINSQKKGLIEVTNDDNTRDETGFPKHTGGGWYELSNGEKVQGKDEAVEAEKELKQNE